MTKPTLYIETSVPSYYVSRDARDVVVLAHQQLTRTWWETRIPDFRCFVSPVVLEEASLGDTEQAQRRLSVLQSFEVLEATPEVESLAARYVTELHIPDKALRDAAHLAFACTYALDFLVTWNCSHIANGELVRRLMQINALLGLATPHICTPEELMEKGEYWR